MDLEAEELAQKDVQQSQNIATPPILPSQSSSLKPRTSLQRLHTHFSTEISTTNATPIMLLCCLISGLIDSTIYNAYGTFVSMQTGNTIFVGLGGATSLSTPPTPKPYGWAKSLTSIACFCIGCFFFSQLSRRLGPVRRGTLVGSFMLQAIVVLVCAAVVQGGGVDGRLGSISGDVDWRAEVLIAFLSFQSAGQIVGGRTLGLAEIPSIVVTSMLCDLASDPNLIGPVKSNVKRNRRALAFLGILVGAVVGGFVSEGTGRVEVVLWIAGGLKVGIAVAWMLWPKKGSNIG